MNLEIVWSERAFMRVEELADFVAQRNPAAAASWVESLFERVETLGGTPRMGRVFRGSSNDNVREMLFGQYKVYYLHEEEHARITVLTVRHTREGGEEEKRLNHGGRETRRGAKR